MTYGGDPRVYREYWATCQGKMPSEIYTPKSLRQNLTQCEGCYGPLGDYLDDGYIMGDFNMTWLNCLDHAEPVNNGVPFDVYDDYNSPFI